MFSKIKEFLFGKPVESQAPYKVEAPTIIASGEPPATVVVVEGAGAVSTIPTAVNDQITDSVTQTAKAAKKPAGRKPAGEKKPKAAAMKATPKKGGRKPKSKA